MAAGSGNLQGPLDVLLAQHILEIQLRNGIFLRNPWRLLRKLYLPVQVVGQLADGGQRYHRGPPGQRGLRRVFRRDKQGLNPRPLRGQRHGQYAGHGTNLPVQTDLPQKGAVRSGTADAANGAQNAQQDRKVIVGARLF